jgi:hypothetical protein
VPYSIIGSMQQPALGPVLWWNNEDDEDEEEVLEREGEADGGGTEMET